MISGSISTFSVIRLLLTFTMLLVLSISANLIKSKYEVEAALKSTAIDPQKYSAQINQAKEKIKNELINQGQIITNQIQKQSGFNNVQSNLTQAYQYSFMGNISAAASQLQPANKALDNSIRSLLRSGQELLAVSQNKSVVLDNNSRIILRDFGNSISNISVSMDDIRRNLTKLSPTK